MKQVPKVGQIVAVDGERWMVVDLLSTQFTVYRTSGKGTCKFLFYADYKDTWE